MFIEGIPVDYEIIKIEQTLSFLRALNFFRHSTVSCLCIMDATVERCWRKRETMSNREETERKSVCVSVLTETHGCLRASWAVILLAGLIVNIWLIRFLASGVTESHSGDGNYTHTHTHRLIDKGDTECLCL